MNSEQQERLLNAAKAALNIMAGYYVDDEYEELKEAAESAASGEMGGNDDASRLSEIDERKWCLLFNGTIHHWTVQEYQQVVGCISQGRTAREAIDKAIDNARKTEGAK